MSQLNGKSIVAHFSNTFFVKSETFIYHYLTHMRQFAPICIAWNLENIDLFPFSQRNLYHLQLQRHSVQWLLDGVFKRLFHRHLQFERILKHREVCVLHAHFGHNGVQALAMKGGLKIPLVTTFYGADLSRFDMIRPLREQYKHLFEKGQLFLVEGAYMKEKLHSLGCPENKIQIQRIAIPVDKIKYKERKPKVSGTVNLLFCGRFTEKKGLIYALEAVKRVKKQNRDIRFCAIGDGELSEEIHNYVKQHGLQDCVELPGFLNYDEYLKRVEDADIFIHPSVTASDGDSEGGAPTTILEAQAMGLPIISTYHADIPNIVVPDRSALLSAEKNVDALTQNILFLLENQYLWKDMGRIGREFVEEFHDIKKETLLLEEKYKNL